MTYREIANILGFTEKQVTAKAENLGLTKRRIFNKDYFHNIDTPLKAYFLGFIYADGWIVDNPVTGNYEFGIELQSQDKYILDKLNYELGGIHLMSHSNDRTMTINNRVLKKGHSDVLRVFSKSIVKDLELNGIETNKSQKSTYPIVDKDLFFDFLRGYIDGDGCYYFHKKKNLLYMHITCANEEPLDYIKSVLETYEIQTKLYKECDKKFRLMCTNKDNMYKLLNRLYYSDDLFCLTRKLDKVKSYLQGSAA